MKKISTLHPAVSETLVYGAGTLVSQVLSAFRGLMVASLLGPAGYGLWKSVQVALDWLVYSHFGLLHGMARQIPLAHRAGDLDGETRSRWIGLGAAIGSGLLAGGGLVLLAPRVSEIPWTLWGGIAILLVLAQLFRFIHMTCLADGRFGVLSLANLLLASLSFAVMFWSVRRFGVLGVLLGLGVGYLGALFLAGTQSIFPSRPDRGAVAVTRTDLTALFSAGFPFMVVDGLFVFWQRLDRLILIPYYGAESAALGYYGLATMVASFAIQIPQVFTRVLFRRTVPVFGGSTGNGSISADDRMRHLEIPCRAVAVFAPLLFSLGAVGSGWMVQSFLPEYSVRSSGTGAGCEESIALLLLAAYGCSVGLSFRNVYTGMNRQWRLAVIYLLASLLTLLPPILLLESSTTADPSGIRTAAWGMVLGAWSFALCALFDCCIRSSMDRGRIRNLLLWVIVPGGIYTGWTLFMIRSASNLSSVPNGWQYWVVQALAAAVLHVPVAAAGFLRLRKMLNGNAHPSLPRS